MDKKFNFIISAIIAFCSYILIILLLVSYISNNHTKKYDAISKNTVLELDLVMLKDNITKENLKGRSENYKKVNKIIKKSKSISAKRTTNLKSLFARVSTKSSKIKTKQVMNIRSNDVNSRFKSKYSKVKKEKNVSLSKLIDVKSKMNTKKINISNNKGNYDKYYSKISSIILSRWYQYPLFKVGKYLVIVEVKIDNQGKFSYHILSFSGDLVVDDAIKLFLSNETKFIYPIPPDHKDKIIKINFKPELK